MIWNQPRTHRDASGSDPGGAQGAVVRNPHLYAAASGCGFQTKGAVALPRAKKPVRDLVHEVHISLLHTSNFQWLNVNSFRERGRLIRFQFQKQTQFSWDNTP